MKKRYTTAVTVIAILSFVLVGAVAVSGASAMTKDEVLKTWGKPLGIKKLNDGTEMYYFKIDNTMDIGNPFFVFRDGQVVRQGMGKYIAESKPPIQPEGSCYMTHAGYYEANPTSVDDIIAHLGKPSRTMKLTNGREELYYKVNNTMDIGYHVFVAQNGRILGEGMGFIQDTNTPARYSGQSFSDASKSYYASHPTQVNAVVKKWGKPSNVKKLDNGMEILSFKIDNTMSIPLVRFLVKDGTVVAQGM